MNNRIFFLPIIGITTFFTLLLIYTKLVGPIPFSVTSVTTQKSTTFDVTGEGKVDAQPDIATVTVGIQANGSTVKVAQDQINTTINNISKAIKDLGVDQKDVQTTNYNINPNYDFREGQRITGYSASTNLQIKVRQIDNINSVIDTATTNGANQVSSISFDVDDKIKLQNEAREKAVADAKSKAENAAKIAGFRLGKIINYSENFGGYPIPIPLRSELAVGQAEVPTTQIEPGSAEITVNVNLSYQIE
ncbi:MAG: SIMPL domain-containing protein [Candidatus Daviesbacteria bacterium]|nr:SIMPL domain-containing protein [Candidatus Daviesbacteria bacterium]